MRLNFSKKKKSEIKITLITSKFALNKVFDRITKPQKQNIFGSMNTSFLKN